MARKNALTLGERIKIARGDRSHQEFIFAMPRRPDGKPAMSESTLRRLEKDSARPNARLLGYIAEVEGVDRAWLYGENGGVELTVIQQTDVEAALQALVEMGAAFSRIERLLRELQDRAQDDREEV